MGKDRRRKLRAEAKERQGRFHFRSGGRIAIEDLPPRRPIPYIHVLRAPVCCEAARGCDGFPGCESLATLAEVEAGTMTVPCCPECFRVLAQRVPILDVDRDDVDGPPW